jgi:hypothetical protein
VVDIESRDTCTCTRTPIGTTGHLVSNAPLVLGFLTCTPRNGFFVFILVKLAFVACCAVRAGVDAEVLAKMSISFMLLFLFVVFF